MIRLPLETEQKLDEAVRKMRDELSKLEDRFTEEQIFCAIKEAVLSGDFQQLVQPVDTYRTYNNEFVVTKRMAITYVPYREAMRLEDELKRYREVVNSILNVEQQQLLAQKLHEIQDTQDA